MLPMQLKPQLAEHLKRVKILDMAPQADGPPVMKPLDPIQMGKTPYMFIKTNISSNDDESR
jgi:hypothetical protein